MANVRWSQKAREQINYDLTTYALFDSEGGGYWSLMLFESGIVGRNPLDSEIVAEVQAWEDYNIAHGGVMSDPNSYDLSYHVGRTIMNRLSTGTYTDAKDTFPVLGKVLVASLSSLHSTGENLKHSVNKTSPTDDVTMDFARITSLVPAINSGVAGYFLIKEINPIKKDYNTPTMRPMLFGTIGAFGSGADMEISDVNIVSGRNYRFPPISFKLPVGPLVVEVV